MIIVWTYDRAQQFYEVAGLQTIWTWIGRTDKRKYITIQKQKIVYDHIFYF